MKTVSMEIAVGEHRFVTKEARTVTNRTCSCCRRSINEMCFVLFMMHENGGQWVVVGWQCFNCERAKCEVFYPHETKLGVPFRLRRDPRTLEWHVHERQGDEFGWLDVHVGDFDEGNTEQEAAEAYREYVTRKLEQEFAE